LRLEFSGLQFLDEKNNAQTNFKKKFSVFFCV
jgi:hypothetical protein